MSAVARIKLASVRGTIAICCAKVRIVHPFVPRMHRIVTPAALVMAVNWSVAKTPSVQADVKVRIVCTPAKKTRRARIAAMGTGVALSAKTRQPATDVVKGKTVRRTAETIQAATSNALGIIVGLPAEMTPIASFIAKGRIVRPTAPVLTSVSSGVAVIIVASAAGTSARMTVNLTVKAMAASAIKSVVSIPVGMRTDCATYIQ